MKNNHTKSSNIILTIILVVAVLFSAVYGTQWARAVEFDIPIVIEAPSAQSNEEVVEELPEDFVDTRDRKELQSLLEECDSLMEAAHQMADAARALGYDESHEVIVLAKQEYADANYLKDLYQQVYDEVNAVWEQRSTEYPTATYVWLYLDDLGMSDAVKAGILGNMMVECGGNTLSLESEIYSSAGYYGLCQWSIGYQANMSDKDLESQCEFLANTIARELNTYGHLYKRGFDYSSFMSLTNEKEAALAFARAYERCGFFSYGMRRACATTAYNYFCG